VAGAGAVSVRPNAAASAMLAAVLLVAALYGVFLVARFAPWKPAICEVPLVGRKVSPVSDVKGEEACLFKHGESSTDGGGFCDRVIAAYGEANTFKEVGTDMFYGVFGIPYGIEALLVVIKLVIVYGTVGVMQMVEDVEWADGGKVVDWVLDIIEVEAIDCSNDLGFERVADGNVGGIFGDGGLIDARGFAYLLVGGSEWDDEGRSWMDWREERCVVCGYRVVGSC
jgi:hypothetical protein